MFENYPDLLTIGQMQNALGIGKTTAYKLVRDGTIKHLRIGKAIKIPKKYLVEFVMSSCYNNGDIVDGCLVGKE